MLKGHTLFPPGLRGDHPQLTAFCAELQALENPELRWAGLAPPPGMNCGCYALREGFPAERDGKSGIRPRSEID